MGIEIESLFTSALGLSAPWRVEKVDLDTAHRRIDFDLTCDARRLACPVCGLADQGIHDRQKREWRHLDFFQYEAWLHAEVPRIACNGCGKTTQMQVPWAREGSGFTALFEALALSLCRELPVRQAAALLRCTDKQLWRRIERYVDAARKLDDMSAVRVIGIDETSLRKGQNYITVVHDLEKKRLLFACEGKDHQTIVNFAQDLQAHGGKPEQIEHVCQDMSAAFAKGVSQALPQAQISYDRFHVVAMANEAMDEVRREETRTQPQSIKAALGENDRKLLKSLTWGMRRNPDGWSVKQTNAMHWLQHSTLKSARAWRLKMALRTVYANALKLNDAIQAKSELGAWLSWATRCRLAPFKKLASTLKQRLDGVVRGMLDNRSNAYVEAMNGLLQQAKRAARGFRTATNFIAIAYLRMSKLKHLPGNPLAPALPKYNVLIHRCL
ncbi:ISL3 family transposase [Rhodoferax sp.]|uniref:ISL3 family transposase n=1 Tax=Rhodoferax sp. TaxID=50421 RepID=UPI00185AF1EE|nr:ISL3 family transposase [Rhodoferax sp.]MBA3057097.1 ISL3 family transposase [Rhodoferax sp.]